jgi:hypothetical protein
LKTLVAFLVILIIGGSVLSLAGTSNAAVSGPVSVTGPSSVAINSSFNYTVSVQQIFTNYSAIMLISGYNLTGASPISPTYHMNLKSNQTVFSIKAPSVATTLFLLFQVKGNLDNHSYYYNLTSVVAVKAFTKLVASIKNPSEFNLTAINVTFEVNGKYVGSKIVNISRNSTENVTFQWVSGNLPTGIYTVTISINSRIVQLQNGNSYTFKIQSGNPFTIYIYIGIIAFLAIIIVVMMIANYYARKRRPKWKK